MIADQSRELREQLQEVAKAEEREGIVRQLNDRIEDLTELRDEVLAATLAISALGNRTEIVGEIDGKKAHERVAKLRESLAVDPQSITKGRDLTNMKKAFEKFAQQVRAAIETTWTQYKPKASPKVDANQLNQAEQQPAFKSAAKELRANVNLAERASVNAPDGEQAFAELETIWNRIRELTETLPAVAEDPAVQDFLKAVNSQNGAPLELLTDEVRKWLFENRTADKYRIFNA
jgi:hypothetical protein